MQEIVGFHVFTKVDCWEDNGQKRNFWKWINNLSAESKKGIDAVQRCSVENQKGAIAVQSLVIAPFREKNYTGVLGDFAPEMQKRALENCHRLQCKSLFNVAGLVNGM